MTTPKTPEGWQLVPKRASNHMMNQAVQAWHSWKSRDNGGCIQELARLMWDYMIDSAPAAPTAEGVGSEVAPTLAQAYEMGAKGAPATERERLLFEEWMRGHCWALCATWNGKQYVSDAEQGGDLDPRAMVTRGLFAAWRDRAALAPTAPAGGEAPVAYIRSDHLQKARRAAFLCHVQPEAQTGFTPLYTHPSADLRDAARYRWLRSVMTSGGEDEAIDALNAADPNPDTPEKFDAAVDAAIASLEAAISRKGKTE